MLRQQRTCESVTREQLVMSSTCSWNAPPQMAHALPFLRSDMNLFRRRLRASDLIASAIDALETHCGLSLLGGRWAADNLLSSEQQEPAGPSSRCDLLAVCCSYGLFNVLRSRQTERRQVPGQSAPKRATAGVSTFENNRGSEHVPIDRHILFACSAAVHYLSSPSARWRWDEVRQGAADRPGV